MMETNSDGQLTALQRITDDYSRTPAGRQAMMKLGDIYLARKEYDKAMGQFKELSEKSASLPALKVAALHKMAEVLLAKAKPTEAADVYLRAAALPDNLLRLRSRFMAGICFEKAHDYKRAAEQYRYILDNSGEEEGDTRRMSEGRLIWLAANGTVGG